MASLFTFPPQKTSKLNIPEDEPIYRVIGKGFFDGASLLTEYDDAGKLALIAFDGVPNFNLLPMNELALLAVEEWLKDLETGKKESQKHPEYKEPGNVRSGIMSQDIEIKAYMNRIQSSNRFDATRVEAATLSNKINKATTRRVDLETIETPEIKSVSVKKRDQRDMING